MTTETVTELELAVLPTVAEMGDDVAGDDEGDKSEAEGGEEDTDEDEEEGEESEESEDTE